MFNGLSGGQPGLSAPTWTQLRTFFAIPGIEHIPFVLDSLAGGRGPTDDVEAIVSRAIAPMQQSLHLSLSLVFNTIAIEFLNLTRYPGMSQGCRHCDGS